MPWFLFLFAALLSAQESAPKKTTSRHESIRKKMEQGLAKQRRALRKQAGSAVGTETNGDAFFTVPWTRDPAEEPIAPVTPLDQPKPQPANSDESKPPGEAKPDPPTTAVSSFCPPLPAPVLDTEIRNAATKNRLPESLLRALIHRESSFDPCAVSNKGALGLMQLMPATATDLGVSDPFDPIQSIQAGARYLAQLVSRYGGDLRLALSAYNAGPGAVDRYGDVPPFTETRDFVEMLLGAVPLLRDTGIGQDARGLRQ